MDSYMKYMVLVLVAFFSFSGVMAAQPSEIAELGSVFDRYGAKGSILIWDRNDNSYMGYNLKRCAERFSPASTFKITNTLIALETGVATPETVIDWDGRRHAISPWERDMNLSEAFRVSAVPVYQEIARRIGTERMRYYLAMLDYGDMDIKEENIDKFWLEGESRISQWQQVFFLARLYEERLPVSREAMTATKKIMIREKTTDYILCGKTGWAVMNQRNVLWFVGWLETMDNVYVFALNVEPSPGTDINYVSRSRVELTKVLFLEFGIILH